MESISDEESLRILGLCSLENRLRDLLNADPYLKGGVRRMGPDPCQ